MSPAFALMRRFAIYHMLVFVSDHFSINWRTIYWCFLMDCDGSLLRFMCTKYTLQHYTHTHSSRFLCKINQIILFSFSKITHFISDTNIRTLRNASIRAGKLVQMMIIKTNNLNVLMVNKKKREKASLSYGMCVCRVVPFNPYFSSVPFGHFYLLLSVVWMSFCFFLRTPTGSRFNYAQSEVHGIHSHMRYITNSCDAISRCYAHRTVHMCVMPLIVSCYSLVPYYTFIALNHFSF